MANNIIAGAPILDKLKAEQAAARDLYSRDPNPRVQDSAICACQQYQAARGYLGAEMVESIYGWTLRYASGLQNFGIIATFPVRSCGSWEQSYKKCEAFAKDWAAADAAHRYVIAEPNNRYIIA
jgi:hypothetical protein